MLSGNDGDNVDEIITNGLLRARKYLWIASAKANDFIVDDTYTNPNNPIYKMSVESFGEVKGTSDSDAIKAASVLAIIGSAFFAAGIAATIKFGATAVFAIILGLTFTGEGLLAVGLIIFIICIIILAIVFIGDGADTFITLETY